MHLSDTEPDAWDRILARKADEAPAAVAQRDRTERGWWMYAGAAMLAAAFIMSVNGMTLTRRSAPRRGPLTDY